MNKQTARKFTKTLTAFLLVFAMLLSAAPTVQAAQKATVKKVSGVKFQKASGADKTTFMSLSDTLNTGKYVMYLKQIKAGKTYLISTKDGKKYTQTDLKKVAKKQGKLSKKNAENLYFAAVDALDGMFVLYGTYGMEKPFILTTKDGENFSFSKMPDFKEFSSGARIWKVGSTYVWIRGWVEGRDEIIETGNDGEKLAAAARFKYYISDDKKTWEPKYISLKGIADKDSETGYYEMLSYADAQRKGNKYLVLDDVKVAGDYLYVSILYRPSDSANPGETSEYYVYRTKDFETYEKVTILDKELPAVKKNTAEHVEELYLTKADIKYGAVTDWDCNWKKQPYYSINTFTFTRSAGNTDNFEEVFSYDPGSYKSRTIGAMYNWEGKTGKNVSLFFEREKDGSLFVSKDGKSNFKEYEMPVALSNCCGIWVDEKNGYKILGYKKATESDGIDSLLFSKNGFVKSYQVALPDDAQGVEIKGNLLLVTAQKGNYYVKLSDLYKKLK